MANWKKNLLNFIKNRSYGLIASIIIIWSLIFRIILTMFPYPEVNSDEGTMGIEAMHIAFQGQHPIYLYGQNYMGVLEAYIAAPFFHLFGVSVFTLRLGMLLMFGLFMVVMYWLSSLFYSKKIALITLFLLSLATSDMLVQQLRAVGGAIETLLFGALMFVISYLLASEVGHQSYKRYLLYSAWGFTAGIALWVHILVLPFVLSSGLLILIFCYREWRSMAIPCLLLGLFVGGFLLIPGYKAIPNALSTQGGEVVLQGVSPAERMNLFQKQLVSTFLWGIPLTTWIQPICTYQELPYLGHFTSSTLSCSVFQGAWSIGYLTLLTLGLTAASSTCWKLWKQRYAHYQLRSKAGELSVVTHFARLMLLFTGCMVIVLYLRSPLSGLKPESTRYLVGLLVVTPGILWPIWRLAGLEKLKLPLKSAFMWLSRIVLVFITSIVLTSTISTLSTIPVAYADAQQQQKLIQDLLRMNIRHVYLEYWSCYRLLFQSQEHILCATPPYPTVVGSDRYAADARLVQPNPHVINPAIPFLFPIDNKKEITDFELYNKTHHKYFQKYIVDDMVLYVPLSSDGKAAILSP